MAAAARPRCTRCIPPRPTPRAPRLDTAAFLERLAAAPLLYQPGTVWDYGLSIDVIGLVVEAISGQSLGAFLEQRLFRPLGMVDTSFQVPPDKVARLARPLPRDPDTGAAQSVPDRAQALRFECGGGGLASTALDYLRFAQMLLGGGVLGDTRILGRKTVEAMRTNRMTPDIENRIAELDPNSDGYGFGLTVAVRERAGTLMGSLGEFYWNGAYGTLWWADPVEDLAVVFMAQVPGEQRRRFRPLINALVYQALTELTTRGGGIAMKITDIIAHPLSVALAQPRWTAHEFMDRAQIVLVEVRTDQGIVGFGEISGGPQTVICDLVKTFSRVVHGMDPLGHTEIWTKLFSLTSPRPGGLGGWDGMPAPLPRNQRPQIMAAIGGIDIALWDIKGKAAGLPVFRVARRHADRGVHLCDRRILSGRRAARCRRRRNSRVSLPLGIVRSS